MLPGERRIHTTRGARTRNFLLLRMLARDFLRQRTILLFSLFFVSIMPLVGYVVVDADAPPLPYLLDRQVIVASARGLSTLQMMFTGIAFVASFVGFSLVLNSHTLDKRLVTVGYRPYEVMGAKLLLLFSIVLPLLAYTFTFSLLFYVPTDSLSVVVGLLLGSLIFGALGILFGLVFKNKLAATYAVLITVVVDVGFLESPVFSDLYTARFMTAMPGFYPMRLIVEAGFQTVRHSWDHIIHGMAYFSLLMVLGLVLFWKHAAIQRRWEEEWGDIPGKANPTD